MDNSIRNILIEIYTEAIYNVNSVALSGGIANI